MIICKFTKTDSAVYIPHLDLLREMGRAVRRADLRVSFSEGFNPHMLLYFSQPLPLGMNSIAEYFCAESPEKPEDFMERINKKTVRGVRVLAAAECEKASVHAEISHSAYRYKFSASVGQEKLDEIMSATALEIPVKTKKGIAVADVRARVASLKSDGEEVTAVLGCGFNNLRADSFGAYIAERLGLKRDFEVVKTAAFAERDGALVSVDDLYGLKPPQCGKY